VYYCGTVIFLRECVVLKKPSIAIFSTISIFIFTIMILAPKTSEAQTDNLSVCSALAQEALDQSAQNCGDLGVNDACYGYNRVSVLFNRDLSEDLFSEPSDRADVAELQTIETSAYNQSSAFWGVAVMKLQANIPNTLPGQAVTFILMGETEVQDAAPAEGVVLPSTVTVAVQPLTRSNIRSKPTTRANVVAIVESGQALDADAVDETGSWVRVTADGVPGWISSLAVGDPDVSTLPVITGESFAPMQAFYLKTKFGKPECDEAPSTLLVQGPKNIAIDLRVNGADITISSSVLLRTTDENTLELIVLDGKAVVGNLTIPTGFRSFVPLNNNTDNPEATAEPLAMASGDWQGCQPLTEEERASLQTFTTIPASLLSYEVTVPEQASGSCPRQGFITTNPQGQNNTQTQTNTNVDCSNFRPTSPLGGASFGLNTFYWDAAPGATSYRVKLYNIDGAYAGAAETSGSGTSLSLDTSIAAGGYSFTWEVEALVNGQVACTSSSVTMSLGAPQPPPQSPGQHSFQATPSPAITPPPFPT
jgi:hypothetical protein